jgi:hypothetical protein
MLIFTSIPGRVAKHRDPALDDGDHDQGDEE